MRDKIMPTATTVHVVIPTCNEIANLRRLSRELLTAIPSVSILVVDDASTDGTAEVADALGREDSRFSVIHRGERLGIGSAYKEGFQRALASGSSVVVQMDGDGSHQVSDLPLLLAANATGADLAIGSRAVLGAKDLRKSISRRLLTWAANSLSRIVLQLSTVDATSGFRVFSSAALSELHPDDALSNGFFFQIEMVYRSAMRGLSIVEVPITFKERREGRSKLSMRVCLEALWMLLQLRVSRGRTARDTTAQ